MKPVQAMMELYRGLNRARGVWNKSGTMETVREAPLEAHFQAHLDGQVGVGIVPIMDDGNCWWGAIDIDAHEDGKFIDLGPLCLRVEEFALPLVVCQSKSQGAHLYLFLKEALPASLVQRTLKDWAARLGHPGVEVFPKQTKLAKDQVGNWINLPYFQVADTVRYAFHSGKKLTLVEFLTLAVERRATRSQLQPRVTEDAPPCVLHMLTNGIDEGERNNALFAIGTYFKKRGSDNLEEELLAVNYDRAVMPKALQQKEVVKISNSLVKSNYKYRCNETPICNICDKETCATRKFGVGASGPSKMYDMALWGALTKVLSDPPRYILEVSGVPLEMQSADILDFGKVRQAVFDRAGLLIGPMKREDWDVLVRKKNEDRREVQAPEDAGPGATVAAMLMEFCRSVERVDHKGLPIYGTREHLLRGHPVVLEDKDTGLPLVYLRGADFVGYLKRKRAEEAKGSALWSMLRRIGCNHEKLRIGTSVIQVWTKPFQPMDVEIPPLEVKEQF